MRVSNALMLLTALAAVAAAKDAKAAPGSEATPSARPAAPLECNDTIKTRFKPDALTTVVMVRKFVRGEQLVLAEPANAWTQKAGNDICLVKLLVGPGNPGPADAPSTTAGIGIEVWLPMAQNWNGRVHVIGGGGWVGGWAGSPTAIAEPRAAAVAGTEGAVSSSTDAGHSGTNAGTPSSGGDFAMNPDGSINRTLWEDFAGRAIHEQAVKTKALATAFYGRTPSRSYWDGASTGGRQALKLAQEHPEDFDGIIATMPAINWTRLTSTAMYAQVVFQRDLGGAVPSEAQQDLVSSAAIKACDMVGGQHLGYIMDPAACRYDPVKDPAVLCVSSGGRSKSPDCVSSAQALAFDKIWYGITEDGSVPSPALDNGTGQVLDGVRRWYGLPRGTSLYNQHYSRLFHVNAGFANPAGTWTLVSDQLALQMQNPTIAAPNFRNATGNGADGWKGLSYRQLANAFDRGEALDPVFARINTDNPDLSAFKARGGKLLGWHGMSDEVIPVQGTIRYYSSVVDRMGDLANVQDFYRLYLVPGNGHGAYNGTGNADANPPVIAGSTIYDALVGWVEQGVAPGRIDIASPQGKLPANSQPICPFPQRARYRQGDPHVATSYGCEG